MSGDGHQGHSADVGHEPDKTVATKENILILKCPSWYISGKYLEDPNPDNSYGDFPSLADLDGPKRRGRPPKTGSHQPSRLSTRSRASLLPKPVGTRSSRRKAEANGDADDQDIEMADAVSDETGHEQKLEDQLNQSEDTAIPASIKYREAGDIDLGVNAGGNIDGEIPTTLANGFSTPKKNSDKSSDKSTTSPTTRAAAREQQRLELSRSNEHPIHSIEAHEHLEDDEEEPVGVVTRAAARSKSAAPNQSMSKIPDDSAAPIAEDSLSEVNETGAEAASVPGTPKIKGRGRWPNGALKGRAAAASFKKGPGKKKGAPGKRKTSDNAVVQAAYDRQAHLRSQYKDVRKMLLKSELSYLDRTHEHIDESPDAYKDTPQYQEVVKFLDDRHTTVLAHREREEQLEKQLCDRQFTGEVSNAWNVYTGEIEDLQVKYEAIIKIAVFNLLLKCAAEEDDNLSDHEDGEYDLAELADFKDIQDALAEEEETVLVDNEPVKKGKATTKPKRGKKRFLEDEPLVQQIAKRHAPAMLSAHTLPEEEIELDTPSEPAPAAPVGTRTKKDKYQNQFDEYGTYLPTEGKKGPQREEPNNRVVIQPWYQYEEHEIGLRNLYDENNRDNKPHYKNHLPTGYFHLDPHRGVYNVSNKEEDYDQRLVATFGVHPTMGLPCKGSRNPDDVFPQTDYANVNKIQAPPLRYIDEKHHEPVSVSRSWDILTTERDWTEFEKRMDAGFSLKSSLGQRGLATFDAIARDYNDGATAVVNMLNAAEALERATPQPRPPTRTVSPSPGKRQSARQKAKAEALAAAKAARQPSPMTPPQPPPITSTASLSILADASELMQKRRLPQSPQLPLPHHLPVQSYQRSPPAQRTQSQLPHISFINNPMPSSDHRPIAPQLQHPQHQSQQPFLQPRPQPLEMQRPPYQGPGMMAPPPLQPRPGGLPFPTIQSHQPSMFYGSHPSPPQMQQQQRNMRSNPGLRSILPRGEPAGPPVGVHPLHHQQGPFYHPGPPPPQHMGDGHHGYYSGPPPPQHISPYRNEPYQPYAPGPSGPPPGYGPFRHQSPRR